MHIEQLKLKNYRNYQQLDIEFDHKVNVIIGENAQGKTNLMEAIYVLSFTKSHRTSSEKELIRWDEDFAKIVATISKEISRFPLEIIIYSNGKKSKLQLLYLQRLSDYILAFIVVMLAHEDFTLVIGAPNSRQKLIVVELGLIQSRYIFHLIQHGKVLKL